MDYYCGESGMIPVESVIMVLKMHQVEVTEPNPNGTVIIAGSGVVQAQHLPELVPRRMVHYLSRKFNISIERFYHPSRTHEPSPTKNGARTG